MIFAGSMKVRQSYAEVRQSYAEGRRRLSFLRRGHTCRPFPPPPRVADLILSGEGWGLTMPVRRFSTAEGVLNAVGELNAGQVVGTYAGPFTFVLRGTDGVDLCVGSNDMRPAVNLCASDSLSVTVPLAVTPNVTIARA